jgi:hemoglobin
MRALISTAILGLLTFAVPAARPATVTGKTLYQRLGGQPAIEAVANGLVDSILADSRVNPWFTHAAASLENTLAYKHELATFLCQGTQGPCKYTGPDMTAAHKGRHVTPEAFDAVVEDLVKVLNKLNVPAQEKGEVLALLAPLKTVIVQK